MTRGNQRRRYVKPLQENNSIFLDFNLETEFSVAVPGLQQNNEALITLWFQMGTIGCNTLTFLHPNCLELTADTLEEWCLGIISSLCNAMNAETRPPWLLCHFICVSGSILFENRDMAKKSHAFTDSQIMILRDHTGCWLLVWACRQGFYLQK